MSFRRLGVSLAVLAWLAVGFGGAALVARGASADDQTTVTDAVGDAGSNPDISVFTATVTGDALTLSTSLANRTGLGRGESIQFFIHTTGGGLLNAAVFDSGETKLSLWTGFAYQTIHGITGSWSGGTFTTTLSLSDLQSAVHQPVQPALLLWTGTYVNSSSSPTLVDRAPDNGTVGISTDATPTTTTTDTTTTDESPPAPAPQLAMRAVRVAHGRVEWKKIAVVHVPAHSAVGISCAKGCHRSEQVRVARGVATSKRFVNVPFVGGTSLFVKVTQGDGTGYWFKLTAGGATGPAATSTQGCIKLGGEFVDSSGC